MGVRGSEEGEKAATAWVASSCLLFPRAQLSVQNPRSCDKRKFLENSLYASGEWEVKPWPIIPAPQGDAATGNTDTASPGTAQPGPAHLPLPRGPRHLGFSLWKFTQPQRHKCTSNPGASARALYSGGTPWRHFLPGASFPLGTLQLGQD